MKAQPCHKELRRIELTRYQKIEKHFEQPLQKEAEEKMRQVRYTFVELPIYRVSAFYSGCRHKN